MYIQLLEYLLFLVIKNINIIDHPEYLKHKTEYISKYSLEWPNKTRYTTTFKKLYFQRIFCQMKTDKNKSEYTFPYTESWKFQCL
jgi:hypothetical protein